MLLHLALTAAALSSFASAGQWEANFYAGYDCGWDLNRTDYYSVYGTAALCVYAGNPLQVDIDCTWWTTESGNTGDPCTAPMLDPRPMSFEASATTECTLWIGNGACLDDHAQVVNIVGDSKTCTRLDYPADASPENGVSFSCWVAKG
ncbi:Hypothetical predicted protein [Lecanosticta acicola]|uniref:Secreted protein n=1 Tax=Lecanosticta acicola TaxID=111012 RepID=A0AAI8Z219_9PEZI|nr:Hypothetical predicted protein [Lecanosticta acicola]